MKYLALVFILAFGLLLSCDSNSNAYGEGAYLYQKNCENCHMEDGSGLEALYPPLAKSDRLQKMGATVACIIVHGLTDTILVNGVEYNNKMLPITDLSAVEITNIVNYINNSWGNKRDYIQLQTIEKALKNCP